MWLRCIVVKTILKTTKPINPAYPTVLKTFGDHLRKVRLDRNLSQNDLAELFNVTVDSITGWELNRNRPRAKHIKEIFKFLGYDPFDYVEQSLSKRLLHARLKSGRTQKEVAKYIGCDASNLRIIELGKRNPQTRILKKIEDFINNSDQSNII